LLIFLAWGNCRLFVPNIEDGSMLLCKKTGIFLKKSLCQPYKKFKISAIIHQKFLRANVNENFGG
jgi:hypothetical protein